VAKSINLPEGFIEITEEEAIGTLPSGFVEISEEETLQLPSTERKTLKEAAAHGFRMAGLTGVKGLAGLAKMEAEVGGRLRSWAWDKLGREQPKYQQKLNKALGKWGNEMSAAVDQAIAEAQAQPSMLSLETAQMLETVPITEAITVPKPRVPEVPPPPILPPPEPSVEIDVYVNPECNGIMWGSPSKELIQKIMPEFVQLATGTVKKQFYSTSHSPFVTQGIIQI